MSRWDDFIDDHPHIATALTKTRSFLPPINFITLHYAYFIVVCLVSSLIFWGSPNPALTISYTDSLFLVVSAMTEAGLNTVNLSQMTTWQQTLLFLLIILGSSIWVSIWTVLARKHVFEKRFDDIVKAERIRRTRRTGSSLSLGLPMMRRFTMSFRKTQTAPNHGTALPTMGSKVTPPATTEGNSKLRVEDAGSGSNKPPASDTNLDAAVDVVDHAARTPTPQQESDSPTPASPSDHITFANDTHPNTSGQSISSAYKPPGGPGVTRRNGNVKGPDPEKPTHHQHHLDVPNFLTKRTVGRNAQFHDLSSEERERLGGCEYRALKVLAVIVPLYFFLWQFLGCIALGAWVNNNLPEAATGNGINPWWAGIFNGASAFNNSGMSLLDANMIPFETSYFVLITMGLMILAGNTAYPIFLRLIIWTGLNLMRLATAEDTFRDTKATFEFILQYPRRVYTSLFPSRPTWWLLFMLIMLNCVDWVSFELMNLGNPAIEAIPQGSRVLDGLFQALAVRSGGFYVVPISQVYIGLQVLYVIMMYISVYPVVITMRHSNVYEERSLGIYADDPDAATPDPEDAAQFSLAVTPPSRRPTMPRRLTRSVELSRALHRTFAPWHGVGVQPPVLRNGGGGNNSNSGYSNESRISFISQQIHGQLAHDLWWLVLAVLVITTIETSHFLSDPVGYSVFNVLFEVVSAYGCVGISVGLPFAAYSFSGGWHGASKLVLCLVMLRGRHRGLPVALDRAVRLPGDQLHRDEEEDYRIRRSMTSRQMSLDA